MENTEWNQDPHQPKSSASDVATNGSDEPKISRSGAVSASHHTGTDRTRKTLTQERVRELFDYREDGWLVRKSRTANSTKAGDVVGCPNGRGYLTVMVDWWHLRVHRVIWLWHHGYMPENGVDHIDRDITNNRIGNLREVSHSCNMRNVGTGWITTQA